jgi:hypothetical protein
MLPRLTSISAITKVIPTTGSMPVVVMAEDLEDYACKYDSRSKLINEYVAHQFLQVWGINTFSAAFIQIRQEHITPNFLNNRIQKPMFEKPTFGLRYDNDAGEINDALLGIRGENYEINKFTERFDLMNIGLFDLWVANDDRNHNNYNLLTKGTDFIAIDHSTIFDGDGLGRNLSPLTWEDSILSSDLSITFLNSKQKREARHTELLAQFPTFVNGCRQALPEIIEGIPNEWCNNKANLTQNILTSVIDNGPWLQGTISTFSELIHNFNR